MQSIDGSNGPNHFEAMTGMTNQGFKKIAKLLMTKFADTPPFFVPIEFAFYHRLSEKQLHFEYCSILAGNSDRCTNQQTKDYFYSFQTKRSKGISITWDNCNLKTAFGAVNKLYFFSHIGAWVVTSHDLSSWFYFLFGSDLGLNRSQVHFFVLSSSLWHGP